jgi:hypothetical protein
MDSFKMITGPAPGQSMKNWLAWTGGLEIYNAVQFSVIYVILGYFHFHHFGPVSLTGSIMTALILAQGGWYWLAKRSDWFDVTPAARREKILRGLYFLDYILAASLPVVILITLGRLLLVPDEFAWPVTFSGWTGAIGEWLVGGVYYLFGVGEFLHYFVFKINMRPDELRRMQKTGKLIPARFLRELRRATTARQAERGASHPPLPRHA